MKEGDEVSIWERAYRSRLLLYSRTYSVQCTLYADVNGGEPTERGPNARIHVNYTSRTAIVSFRQFRIRVRDERTLFQLKSE